MGVTLMEFGNDIRKGVMFTIRGCLHHPFLVLIVCGMIYISRAFPFMFSLFLPAAPVVVCTVVLLGTLLYYGQQSIHETEIGMKSKYEGVSHRNHKFIDANTASAVAETNEQHFIEKCGESVESNLVGRRLDEIRVGVDELGKGISVGTDGSSKGTGSSEIGSENDESGEESEGLSDHRVHEEDERGRDGEGGGNGVGDGDGEVMADHYAIISKVIGDLLESESDHEKSDGESDHEKSDVDSGDSERGNRVDHHEGEAEGGRESSDSGTEGSSPDDASIEDIMPTMLHELHPLLDEDAPHPPQMSHASSEASLNEHSRRPSNDGIDSADETDIQESEVADDDDDDDEADDDTEDHTQSVITWTEEDQKNLMEVGNSEIERNRRLERIIRRRRNRSMVPEINLSEYKNSDLQLHIAPISTARRNPFDLPQDSGPGSAPSILSQRRMNPFELPDDLVEEDLNEMGDRSRIELRPSLTRHPFLSRRNNFSARPSIFSRTRLEGRPVKIKPFFVAEQVVADESSYSPFKRQSSEHSSGPEETDSVGSVEYFEDEGGDDSEEDIEDDPSMNHDGVSNEQESADTSASLAAMDKGPNRGPAYETDTSPTARADQLEVEPDGDGMQVGDASSAH